MAEIDIFSKLSRILETHSFEDNDPDLDIDHFLNDRERSESYRPSSTRSQELNYASDNYQRPTPFEVWRSKQQHVGKTRETPKLNPHEWDRLVEKMHQTNRVKHSAMVKEQNQGLALELGGHEFKPRMNNKSLELASTMKSLSVRMPEMLAKREKFLATRAAEAEKEEKSGCPFKPELVAKMSQRYLKKMGRVAPRTPDDLFRYKEEKIQRNIQRKQIVDEVESKELTFHPQLPAKSAQIKEKLQQSNGLVVDPVTKVTVAKPRRAEAEAQELQYEGSPLTLDSDHPYKHNTNEYISVAVPGAIAYSISFSENTATEPIHDYLKFFKDDTHTDFWGCGKYSGGYGGTAANWPGQANRPPLIVSAPKFVVHFKTNGSVNDWGFQMHVVPVFTVANQGPGGNASASGSYSTEYQPEITAVGRSYTKQSTEPIFDRLYRKGVEKKLTELSQQAELLQQKVNIPLKPWEVAREETGNSWTQSKTHLVKPANAPIIEEMVVDDDEDMPVTVMEYDTNLGFLWKGLRNCVPIAQHLVAPADEEYIPDIDVRRSDL